MDRLGSILGRERMWRDLDEYAKLQHAFSESWGDIFGKLADQFTFLSVRDKTLLLETKNPVWAGEIQFYKQLILEKAMACLVSALGKRIVLRDIKVKVSGQSDKIKEAVSEQVHLESNLKDQIKVDLEKKRKKGMVLCERCGEVYVVSGLCVFCRCETEALSN